MSDKCCECSREVLGQRLPRKHYQHSNGHKDTYVECPDCGTENVIISRGFEETVIDVLERDV